MQKRSNFFLAFPSCRQTIQKGFSHILQIIRLHRQNNPTLKLRFFFHSLNLSSFSYKTNSSFIRTILPLYICSRFFTTIRKSLIRFHMNFIWFFPSNFHPRSSSRINLNSNRFSSSQRKSKPRVFSLIRLESF